MIELSRPVYDGLIEHAHQGAPEEVCGLLGGEHGEEVSTATSLHRAENVSDTPITEYDIDPTEQLELMDAIEDAGDGVAGFYHSHPAGPPAPSETDAERATWPGLSYVIVVLDSEHPYVGSWRWDGEAEMFEQEVLCRR